MASSAIPDRAGDARADAASPPQSWVVQADSHSRWYMTRGANLADKAGRTWTVLSAEHLGGERYALSVLPGHGEQLDILRASRRDAS